jgi:oligoendopeptidase F
VLTLAHEMGHAMHSWFSNRAQPFPTAAYAIFVAEVASTFNETLLRRHLEAAAATADERAFLLGSALDGIRTTLFRQTMFAELELGLHERAERGEALTGERMSALYLELLRDYHGHAEGVMHVGEEYAVEWAAIPHLYYDFYVYQYATGIVAASALARRVVEERPQALERYLGFLAAGGSDHPLALLRAAGVDLERPEPYAETFDAVVEQLDRLESWIEGRATPAA